MAIPDALRARLTLSVIASPLFLVSGPELVIAQCKAGIIGSFPALNARPAGVLDDWLAQVTEELAAWDAAHPEALSAPFMVNHVVQASNLRLEADLLACERYKVPYAITSLGAREEINAGIHAYGGQVFHDVISDRFARKAIEKGADGLIAVAAGAGGHAGSQSPFALVQEIREWFDGPLVLGGCIASGRSILAAQMMGADFAYVGSPFIATRESMAPEGHKQAVADARAEDTVYTSLFTGVPANYLRSGVLSSGLDPDNLPQGADGKMEWSGDGSSKKKVWKDIWSCGQGVAPITEILPAAEMIARFRTEYRRARDVGRDLLWTEWRRDP